MSENCCNFAGFFDGRAICVRGEKYSINHKIVKTIVTIPQRPRGGRVIKEDPHRINDKIRGVQQVRLIGDNIEQEIYSF